MEQGFIDILKKLVDEKGNSVLTDAGKCEALLSDYTESEYKKERRLLLQALDAGAADAIDAAEDIDVCKKQQIKLLREEYFLVKDAAADVVDMLVLILRGNAVKPEMQTADFDDEGNFDVENFGDHGAIQIIGYKSKNNMVRIPPHIQNLPVAAIGEKAFHGKGLVSVTIPDSVTYIGEGAFNKNKLTAVNIPNSVTHIGEYAFNDNKLASVTIPNNVTYIGEGAFGKNELTSVTIPNSITQISNNMFHENNLTSVTIPDSITHIGYCAFRKNNLTSISIPNSVTYVGDFAFYENQIVMVTILGSVTFMGKNVFTENKLTAVNIPNGAAISWVS